MIFSQRLVRRAGITASGAALVAIGLMLLVLPGPGLLVLFAGLGVLSTEYPAVRRLLDRVKERVPERLRRRIEAAQASASSAVARAARRGSEPVRSVALRCRQVIPALCLDDSVESPTSEQRRIVWARQRLIVAVFGASLALAGVQLLIGDRALPVSWLAVPALLGSLVLSPSILRAVSAWTIALAGALEFLHDDPAGLIVSRLLVVGLLVGFATFNAVVRRATMRRLSQVRAVARVAQSALLRETPPSVASARLASRYVSAAAEARVGGDVLDVYSREGCLRWFVGDTRGKGLPAVRLASTALTSFRDAASRPGTSLLEVARAVDESVDRAVGDEDFVTAVFAELHPEGWLQLVNCGHPPPLRVSADGSLAVLSPDTFTTPLGLSPEPRLATFSVSHGDRVVFYTDGLIEAIGTAGNVFRVEDHLDVFEQPTVEQVADHLLERLRKHAGEQLDDDVAILIVQIEEPAHSLGRSDTTTPEVVAAARRSLARSQL
ncbi:MAG: hypothetical protein QOJ62_44 [Actinomycetota bacterium]|nr:hypothetical protein [Actinomycetota bacterium]